MLLVLVVLAVAAVVVGTAVVATGRGGQMAVQVPPPRRGMQFVTPADVARYRPPPSLLGYDPVATHNALGMISRVLAERDAEIERLRGLLLRGPQLTGAAGGDGPQLQPAASGPAAPADGIQDAAEPAWPPAQGWPEQGWPEQQGWPQDQV